MNEQEGRGGVQCMWVSVYCAWEGEREDSSNTILISQFHMLPPPPFLSPLFLNCMLVMDGCCKSKPAVVSFQILTV